jgi:hypothetical protein
MTCNYIGPNSGLAIIILNGHLISPIFGFSSYSEYHIGHNLTNNNADYG